MDPVTTVLILLFAVAFFAVVASKFGIPYPTMMVVGGLIICFLPGLKRVTIDPNLIFNLFLPPLIYGGAWQTSWKDFWTYRRPIFFLAVGLVFFTTAGVALLAMHFIPGFTWPAAFALGAIVSPPDAIAVTAITKKIRLPRRVVFLLDGESLVNDASALVALRFAIGAAATGSFSFGQASGKFALVVVGGVLVGLAVAMIVARIHLYLREPLIETTITFLTPYAAYLLAEQLFDVSGVLATVAAGLYVSWRTPIIMKPQVRLEAYAVWDFVLFMLNGFIFVLFGLGLPSILNDLPDFSTHQLIGYGILMIAGMILLRLAWVIPGTYLAWMVRPRSRFEEPRPSFKLTFLIAWTGMRGVVSLAAALSLPIVVAGGVPFLGRNIIIFLSFFIILVTLVVQSVTLPMVVHFLRIDNAEDEAAEERAARLHAARAALNFLKDLTEATDAFGDLGIELRREYEHRIALLESGPVPLPIAAVGIELAGMDLQREVLSAERQAIIELRANQKITPEIFQRMMADVDADELRLPTRHGH